MANKQTSLKITMEGTVKYVDVTKTTSCDDVIRELVQDAVPTAAFAVFKTTGRKVKMLDGKSRIIGTRSKKNMLSTEFVVRRKAYLPSKRMLEQRQEEEDQSSDESVNQSPSILKYFRSPQALPKCSNQRQGRMSALGTSNLHSVSVRKTRDFLLNLAFDQLEDESCQVVREQLLETAPKLDQEVHLSRDSKYKLTFNRALRTRGHKNSRLEMLPKKHTFVDSSVKGGPQHSTPVTKVHLDRFSQQGSTNMENISNGLGYDQRVPRSTNPAGSGQSLTPVNLRGERPRPVGRSATKTPPFAFQSNDHHEDPTMHISNSDTGILGGFNSLPFTINSTHGEKSTAGSKRKLEEEGRPTFDSQKDKCRFYWNQDAYSDSDVSTYAGLNCTDSWSRLDRAFIIDSDYDSDSVDQSYVNFELLKNTMPSDSVEVNGNVCEFSGQKSQDEMSRDSVSNGDKSTSSPNSSGLCMSDFDSVCYEDDVNSFMMSNVCELSSDEGMSLMDEVSFSREVFL